VGPAVSASFDIVWEGAKIETVDGFSAVVAACEPGAERGTRKVLLVVTTPEGAQQTVAFTLCPVGLEPVASAIAALRKARSA